MALINTSALVVFSRMIDFLPRCLNAIIEYVKQSYAPYDGVQHAGIKSVSIALACARIKGKITKQQVEIITQWGRQQNLYSHKSKIEQRRFRKALKVAVKFFNRQCRLDLESLCIQISAVLPASDRYDVLDLCIKVAAGTDCLSTQQVKLLKLYSQWLQLDSQRFRTMVEKYLPIDAGQPQNIELLLGITSEMPAEQVQQLLTEEFRKWNSRITNQNPDIRKRADKMLRLITDQRMTHTS